MKNLEELIKNKKAKVAIIGLGYVGLIQAVEIAKTGYDVLGIDIDKIRVRNLKKGKSYISDISDEELFSLIKNKKIKAFSNFSPLKIADIVLIAVPTPLDKNKVPDLSYIKNAVFEIKKRLHKEELVILESTSYPGTTEEIILKMLEDKNFKIGRDFYLATVPERIDPGAKIAIREIPRVIGGITLKCRKLAQLFYSQFIDHLYPVSSPKVAEMSKLLENIFRLVNISMINELALLCGKMGIDIWEVIEAAKTKPYGFMAFYPGPGVGGHCIPFDPFYLSYKAKEYGFRARFIELAGEINEGMPHYIVTKVIWALNSKKKPVKDSKILVFGVTYKKDINDTRESPAIEIIADLLRKGAKVDYFDPYVEEFEIKHIFLKVPVKLKPIKYSPQAFKKYDLVLILTDHSGFDYEKLAQYAKLVVDTRNAIKSRKHKNVFWI
jgi:UDP-N-acetyl-D-glucosamine dehydrogenase